MESTRLGLFYQAQAAWPRNESELSQTSEKLRKLLDVPVVLLSLKELGVRSAGLSGGPDPTVEVFLDSIREKCSDLAGQGTPAIRHFQLSRENVFSRKGTQIDSLAVSPVFGRGGAELGWVMAASRGVLNPRHETLLLAAAQHLSNLAVISESEAAVSQRDQFLSIASHELKTPLTSIYGVLQLQERMLRPKNGETLSPEKEKQHSFFKIVIRQVERLNELIDGLLNVSRICNGRFAVDPSDADIIPIARETVQTRLEVIAREAGVRIQFETPEALTAWVDPIRFEEVITNLGMNAIRFSPEGGMVWIRIRQEADSAIVSFRDQGPSVPESDRERIFQPFERAQRTNRLGGLGLGLFISKQIAQLHGGDVVLLEASGGKGNLLEARFPLRPVDSLAQSA